MNPSAIYSKTGKGVQEASGRTSHLARAERAVLAAFDGRTPVGEIAKRFEKISAEKFEQLVATLDREGYIREISSSATAAQAASASRAAASPEAAEDLDFTQILKVPPRPADAAKEATGPAAVQAQAGRAKAAAGEGARARAEAEAKARAEAEAKIRAAREAAARLAAEARARAEAEARAKAEAEERARREAEERARLEAELKAKLEAERRAREEAERKAAEAAERVRREAEERARREAEELRQRLEEERRAREEAERRAREEAERKAREEAERKAREAAEQARREAEALRQKLEAEMRARLEEERRAREEAERRAREEAERQAREEAERKAREAAERARREAEERARREAEELRQRLEEERRAREEAERRAHEEEERRRREAEEQRAREEAERRAREEVERRAREEEERRRREEEERRRREEEERRARVEAERRAHEEAERKAREAAEEARREAEERARREAEELRQRLEEERRAREEAERRAQEEAERRRREEEKRLALEEAERRARKEAERKALEEEARKAREEAERAAREAAERRQRAEEERRVGEESRRTVREKAETSAPTHAPVAPGAGKAAPVDDLLADLEAFSRNEEEERRRKEETEREAKEAAERARREAEERAKREEEERRRQEEEGRRAREEAERRAREEEERRRREEEERRRREEEERRRSAREALAAKAAQQADGPAGLEVRDEDLDLEDVRRDQEALAEQARRAGREKGREEARRAPEGPEPAVGAGIRRRRRLGKPLAVGAFALFVTALALLHVMPLSVAEYEKAASEALGVPVKIGGARLSLITGVEIKFERVQAGGLSAAAVRARPTVGSLFGANKAFDSIELEGASGTQDALGAALFGKAAGPNFRLARLRARQLRLEGPLPLPPLEVEAMFDADGSLRSATLRGPDGLTVQLAPRGAEIGVEISASSFVVPFVPALALSDFSLRGTATPEGFAVSGFDGRTLDGVLSGNARIRWGAAWSAEGELRARAINAAVFAPALLSQGRAEGSGLFRMAGAMPARLGENARLEGSFRVERAALGFDVGRALQTGGAQSAGRTELAELTGQIAYDRGSVQLRNLAASRGAMNLAGAVEVAPDGTLAGRLSVEVKAPTQVLRGTLFLSGTVREPVIRR